MFFISHLKMNVFENIDLYSTGKNLFEKIFIEYLEKLFSDATLPLFFKLKTLFSLVVIADGDYMKNLGESPLNSKKVRKTLKSWRNHFVSRNFHLFSRSGISVSRIFLDIFFERRLNLFSEKNFRSNFENYILENRNLFETDLGEYLDSFDDRLKFYVLLRSRKASPPYFVVSDFFYKLETIFTFCEEEDREGYIDEDRYSGDYSGSPHSDDDAFDCNVIEWIYNRDIMLKKNLSSIFEEIEFLKILIEECPHDEVYKAMLYKRTKNPKYFVQNFYVDTFSLSRRLISIFSIENREFFREERKYLTFVCDRIISPELRKSMRKHFPFV